MSITSKLESRKGLNKATRMDTHQEENERTRSVPFHDFLGFGVGNDEHKLLHRALREPFYKETNKQVKTTRVRLAERIHDTMGIIQ